MGLFDQFPYTNFHELNLMWILEALKEIQTTTEQFVAINSLKYADPIQWNIVSQYEKNTIVIDPLTGTAYISVQPVPSGVIITNTDYWSVVFDLGSFVTKAAKNFTDRWEEATTLTATFPTAAGEWLVWGDTLYIALVNITAGDQYVEGSNISHFTMEDYIGHLSDLTTYVKDSIVGAINSERYDRYQELLHLATSIADRYEPAENTVATITTPNNSWIFWGDKLYLATANINIGDTYTVGTNIQLVTIEDLIGHLSDLNTYVKDSVVGAINSERYDRYQELLHLATSIADRYEPAENTTATIATPNHSWLFWGDKLYLATADINIGDTYTVGTNIQLATIEDYIGHLSDLDTYLKSSIVDGINSVYYDLGAEVTNRTNADNKLQYFIDRQSVYNFFYGKKVLILGDSNSVENEGWRGRTWVTDFRDMLGGINCTIDNNSASSRTVSKYNSSITLVDTVDNLTGDIAYDYVIVYCGVNDWTKQAPLGDMNSYSPYDFQKFNDSFKYCLSEIHSKIPSAAIFVVTPMITNDFATVDIPLLAYCIAMKNAANIPFYNTGIIEGYLAPGYIINGSNATIYSMDGLHPNDTYAPILARFIINSMMSGGVSNDIHSWIKAYNINSNVGSGNAWIKLWGNGETEMYIYITISSNNYQGFLASDPPSWIRDDFVVHEIQGLIRGANQDKLITYFDSINGNPYPDAQYQNNGDIYIIDMKWRPRTLFRTDFV